METALNSILNMKRIWRIALICLLAIVAFGCSRKPQSSQKLPSSGGYFQTPFQSESQCIVEAIVSDLAEQIYFAAHHRLPDQKYFSVVANEKPGTTVDIPLYDLQIRLEPKKSDVRMDLRIDGPIWSPEVYRGVADALANSTGLSGGSGTGTDDTSLLSKLVDSKAETIEEQNKDLSTALENDFANPDLHEKAALLLGAFVLREHSGNFFEIRSPLSRITAHLAMARFLRGSDAYDINGQMAEALSLTMMNDEALALEKLSAMKTNDTAVAAMIRALRIRNTGDYRLLSDSTNCSPIEGIQWFGAMASYISTAMAWPRLSDERKQTVDYVRTANDIGYSVEIGHELLQISLPLEIQEITNVYQLAYDKDFDLKQVVSLLNRTPEYCFSTAPDGKAHVNVIGWGQWAMFFQRHLCHAIQQNFYLMNSMWGVPDDAKQFAAYWDKVVGGLTLYPFVQRFDCTDVESYHKSVDDSFKVTAAAPQFVPAQCWNYLCYKVRFAPLYSPNPNPHINEWHDHNPPPGTVYDLYPRLNHPSLISRADTIAKFEQLHEMAPYDCRISDFILNRKYNGHPTYQQALALYHEVMDYSLNSLRWLANASYDDPKQYEDYMSRAAQLDPSCYYSLGDYAFNHNDEDKAARLYQKAYDGDQDRVRASNHALWLVRYWLKHGRKDRAEQIATEGGNVYSYGGLEAQAVFFELTSNYDAAFGWLNKIDERYNDSVPLVSFCLRYKESTGDGRFEDELQKRVGKIFPKGLEKVSLSDLKGPPTDGVLFLGQNPAMESVGLKKGDVIVAAYGVRVHDTVQYTYQRDTKSTPGLNLIVWQGNAYRELNPVLPGHKFGVDIGNYPPQ